jgi:hypothetical protein
MQAKIQKNAYFSTFLSFILADLLALEERLRMANLFEKS